MSINDAKFQVEQLTTKIRHLELTIKLKDEEITELRSQLDKYKSVAHYQAKNIAENILASNGAPNRKMRALGISAEPKTQKDLQSDQNEMKTFPKIDSTIATLKKAILDNDFLKHLSERNIREIVEHMHPIEYKKDSLIIKEGDVGSILYAMEDGLIEVTKDNHKLCTMGPGKVFGELAILYNCTRTASITALTVCKLWAIEQNIFRTILMRTELLKHNEKLACLKKLNRLKQEKEEILNQISGYLDEMHFKSEKVIAKENEACDCIYFILKGQIKEVKTVKGSTQVVRILKEGDYFGHDEKSSKLTSTYIVNSGEGADCYVLEEASISTLIAKISTSKIEHSKEESISSIRDQKKLSLEPHDIQSMADVRKIATIGVGGFGRVDLVQPRSDSTRSYALKQMKKSHIVETRQQGHIINERSIMLEVRCDFVVKLLKTFRDNKYLYMLMEPCLGGELWTLLRDKGTFDDNAGRFYAGCVIEAFSYLHTNGIIYRDLKPENLLLNEENGYIKLVDFGFAKKIGSGRRTWTFCGTPEYVAPEIILNRGHDFTADLWSLGILIFELLSGNPPFTGGEPMKTYNMILKGIDNIKFPSSLSSSAQHLIKKLCRENPNDRLGHGSSNLKDIRKHKWFNNFLWDSLKARTLKAPYLLPIKNKTDVSNFDSFPAEECGEPPDDLSGWDKEF